MATANDLERELCLDVPPHRRRATDGSIDKAGLLIGKRWPAGSVIRVGFLDSSQGAQSLRERVLHALIRWRTVAERLFIDLSPPPEKKLHVRISFGGRVSWSLIGTDCVHEPPGEATLNLAIDDSSSDELVRRLALHEFGHALGLIHEHQTPAAGIDWDRDEVTRELLSIGWPSAEVEKQYFKVYEANQTQYTAFDPSSIMLYRIPSNFTKNKIEYESNLELSETDIAFMTNDYYQLGE